MHFYSLFLRVIVHLVGIGIVVAGSIGGYGAFGTAGVIGAAVGLFLGLFAAGFVLGIVALLFEIRDSLEAIKEQLAPTHSVNSERREPELSAS